VGEDPVGRQITRDGMGQKVTATNRFCPRAYPAGKAARQPVGLRQVAGGDPKSLDGQANYGLPIPRCLVARENLPKLLQRADKGI